MINFLFDHSLPQIIKEILDNKSSIKQNTLGFSLQKKINRTKETQPHYGGTFTLEEDVILKAGVTYLYGGWIQNDQSINLKFTPVDQLNKAPKQTDIEHEPKFISDILDKMFNDFDY